MRPAAWLAREALDAAKIAGIGRLIIVGVVNVNGVGTATAQ